VFRDELPLPVSAVNPKVGLWQKAKSLISQKQR